ncbi:peptide-N4-asparagine amidase [Dyella japonica]|uniref:Peptide-N(4)-(N-acetyl-beta-glucosaminyl)asparagine amidase n=1 Tax=Dyella japonica A8 TaxID=1217721 RepID=A0A075JY55_9GAMM|nr:peptide-N4-asparagine amidase [Dyella japonica]AIF46392.1 peptide-N(4)-(N-acetyl-beta-glucosaminyl)asparagine amidase [Dyella japonica A8]
MVPGGFVRHLAVCVLAATLVGGFSVRAAADPVVGSTNVATADPTVPRPPGQPCVVTLFTNVAFDDFGTRPYSYAPPTSCSGSWSKVVLEADFSVTAGRQYDRTATLWLGGVNLYFGTTQEPSKTVSPAWHVERDLTDYAALLRNAGQGQAIIGNLVNSTYTGVIHGSARLLFYPASAGARAAEAPDAVYPLGSDPVGSTVSLNTSSDKLSRTLTLPTNVERAYLDVFTQSQGGDEFWYTCVPDAYAAQVSECGGGNFREAEISIDGQPAGVAPVYPWIYTGGVDPYLWRPTPGVQTLNFMPYRVDLTPFAGQLSDGNPHEVAVQVAGANGYFSATAALLVYRDAHAKQVTGKITRNTLAGQAPTPTIGNTLVTASNGDIAGDITTKLDRHFVIEGYAMTSHGRITSSVTQNTGFDDTQTFTINSSTYRQLTSQRTWTDSKSESRLGNFPVAERQQHVSYPFTLDYNQQLASDGSTSAASTVHQGYRQRDELHLFGLLAYGANVDNTVDSQDTLVFDASGSLTSHSGQQSAQTFAFHDTRGSCYRAALTTQAGAVASYNAGQGCPDGTNRVSWFAHPDGSPSSSLLPGH